MKHIILKLEDALALVNALDPSLHSSLPQIYWTRHETGAEIEKLALQTERLPTCTCCRREGKLDFCGVKAANRLGRRLTHLVSRAG